MRKILRWWGIGVGVALLLGAVSAALARSAVVGAVAFGLAMWVVASVAWDPRANRENAAYGKRPRRSGGAADGAFHVVPEAGDGCGGGFDGEGGGGC